MSQFTKGMRLRYKHQSHIFGDFFDAGCEAIVMDTKNMSCLLLLLMPTDLQKGWYREELWELVCSNTKRGEKIIQAFICGARCFKDLPEGLI